MISPRDFSRLLGTAFARMISLDPREIAGALDRRNKAPTHYWQEKSGGW